MADRAGVDSSSSAGKWFEGFRGGKSSVRIRSKNLEVESAWSPSWKKLCAVGGSLVTAYLMYRWYWGKESDSMRGFTRSRTSTSERHLRTYSSPSHPSVFDFADSEDSGEDDEEANDVVYNADPNYIPNIVSEAKVAQVRSSNAQFSSIFNHLCSTTSSVNSSAHSQPGSDTMVFENQNSKSVTPNAAEMENQNKPPNGYVVRTVVNGKTTLDNLRERLIKGDLPTALQVKDIDNRMPPEASSLAAGGPLKKL